MSASDRDHRTSEVRGEPGSVGRWRDAIVLGGDNEGASLGDLERAGEGADESMDAIEGRVLLIRLGA